MHTTPVRMTPRNLRANLRKLCCGSGLFAALLAAGCAAHPRGPHGPACPTITSAMHVLEYPSFRLNMLKRVAGQTDLSQHEQTYLVNAVFVGGFSSQVAETLLTLIYNPCCTDQTRQEIRKHIKFSRLLGRDEQRILAALDKPPTARQPAENRQSPELHSKAPAPAVQRPS